MLFEHVLGQSLKLIALPQWSHDSFRALYQKKGIMSFNSSFKFFRTVYQNLEDTLSSMGIQNESSGKNPV